MMISLFSTVTAFIAAYPHLAYAAVLLLALSESIPVIGVVVPGTAVILAISALVSARVVTLWPLLAAATAGGVIGDGISFWVGHRHHREILTMWPLSRYPTLVARSEGFFAQHGDKSVSFARFTPGVRAFVPLLAGMLRMSPRRFYPATILSFVCAPAHILPDVLIGASFSLFGSAAKPLAVLLVLLAVPHLAHASSPLDRWGMTGRTAASTLLVSHDRALSGVHGAIGSSRCLPRHNSQRRLGWTPFARPGTPSTKSRPLMNHSE